MNCDKGNKTEIFHKAQRQCGGEHDDMRYKPLWGIACVLVCARRRRQTGGRQMLHALRACAAETWGEESLPADNKRKTQVLLDLDMKSLVTMLTLDVQRVFGCILCANVLA